MPLPLIPFAAATVASLGASVLAWYYSLPPEEQEAADERANRLAYEIYRKSLDRLTAEQLERIHATVKRDYA